ncbi:MAG: right-handed parallel beta-helix repeat-containing protein [Armatimonadetes bacterium]|nr:right-handed parallel beta-helix repeat-containing protein [Armatimonadota bacterium]
MKDSLIPMTVLFAACFSAFAVGGSSARYDYYVVPNGSDQSPGTETEPFATLSKARDTLRREIAAGLKSKMTVVVRGGRYELTKPLVFGPGDSGTAEHPITYEAYPGEIVIVSGGRRISGWVRGEGELWTAEVPGVKEGKWYFRQLFVRGERATRARTPNARGDSLGFSLAGADFSGDTQTYKLRFPPGQLKSCRNVAEIEATILGEWEIMRKRLQSIDEAANLAVMAPPYVSQNFHPWNRPGAGKRCYLGNALEFLDQPREWHLDRPTGVLTYWPRPGQDMNKAVVIAPALTRLFEIAGTAERPVRNLHFKGIRFEHAEWPLPHGGYEGWQACHYHTVDGDNEEWRQRIIEPAIRWNWADSCSLEEGEIAHLGGVGLFLGNGCVNNAIVGNHIHDIGGNGVMIGIHGFGGNGVMIRGPKEPSPAVPRNNRIANNYVHACGVDYLGAVGIWVGFTDGTAIAHNELHDLPYSGISVGWEWNQGPTSNKNNLIEYNHIHNVMKRLSDGGGIYTLGLQPGTVIRGNFIHDVLRSGTAVGAPNNGMFIDQGSKGFLFERNLIYATSGAPVRHNQNQSDWHTWKDNRFGGTLPAEGRIGTGLLCDGVSTYLEVPHSLVLEPKQITLEAWIYLTEYPRGADNRRWIINKNDDEWTNGHYSLNIAGDRVGAFLNIGGGQQNMLGASSDLRPLKLKTWHHLAMSYDGAILKVHCDGELAGSTSINRERIPGNTPLAIGRRQDAYNYFKGIIDEVCVYDRPLSDEEVKARFKSPEVLIKKGRVGSWSFEDLSEGMAEVKEIQQKAGLEAPYRDKLHP